MKQNFVTCILLTMLCLGTAHASQLDLPDGRDVSLADIFYPGLHLDMAAGGSSATPDELELGGHDPNRDGFTLQGLELDLSVRLNDHIEGFAAWNLFWGGEAEEWGDEWEEIFGKLTRLPGGLELRGGRMLNRFGVRNAKHQHSWSTVDQKMVVVRFLGEEGLSHEGGEVTWYMPTPFTTALTVSYGEARSHGHGHGDESEEEEEEEAEEILFSDEFLSANLLAQANYDDFNQFAWGGSVAFGDNGFGDDTVIGALNLTYTWRENGLEPGGRYLRWTTEAMLRDYSVGGDHAHEEHGEEDDGDHAEDEEHEDEHGDEAELSGGDEFGASTEIIWGMKDWLDVGTRLGYLEGIDEVGLAERFRVSPLATVYLSKQRNLFLRLQYNYDDLEQGQDAHAGWAQLHYSFGGPEVR